MRVLGGGAEAFSAILGLVRRADTLIEIHAFLWHDDEIGNRLAQAVLEAAERGVTVTIHKDRVAAVYELSGGNKQSFFHKKHRTTERLQAWVLGRTYGDKEPKSKVERKPRVRQRANPLVEKLLHHERVTVSHEKKRFDHSKLFIFDERILVVGSMGIGDDHHDEWVDMMIEVVGEGHVKRLRQRMNGEVEFDSSRRLDFLLHNLAAHEKKTCPMLMQRLRLIESAKISVVIEMAYLGDDRFTNVLIGVVQRGVEVTLVTARDVNVLRSLVRATLSKLLRVTGAPENLTVILFPKMIHAKMVIVDGRYCDVGSANFTKLSHGVYDEVNLYADDVKLATELTAHVTSHRDEGEVMRGPISYKKFVSQIERATVAYQSRNGG